MDIVELKKIPKDVYLASGREVPKELRDYWNKQGIRDIKPVKNTEKIDKEEKKTSKKKLKDRVKGYFKSD